MIKVFINNKEVLVPNNSTVLEACSSVGIEIPRFCYHQRLSVAGNCRMCLVEVEKAPKPVASCTFPVTNNLRVFTDSPLVKKAREGVLELLLMNHPLDCPICDQGGECDLQDQALFFGSDNSRFFEHKRGVEDKACGPLIKTIMTRCIHCTRCVRFMADIAGLEEFGTTNRGRETEIGTYVTKAIHTELSGNIIDLCPVGALTSKPYAFLARPWELRSVESIDLSDALGSNLRVDFKESEIVRVLPRLNENINEEWLSDKARFNFDSFKIQRLVQPYSKALDGTLKPISWENGLRRIDDVFSIKNGSNLSLVASIFLDLETLQKIKSLANVLGVKNVGFLRKFLINTDFPENFTLSTPLKDIALSDFCLLVGTNPRYEAAMLNLKLRKRARSGPFCVVAVGNHFDLTYKSEALGISTTTLLRIAEGKHPICKKLRRSKTPLIITNLSISERQDFLGLKKVLDTVRVNLQGKTNWNPIGFLNQEANQAGALFLGLGSSMTPPKAKNLVFCGLFNEEDLFFKKSEEDLTLFFGSHGNDPLLKSDVILPLNTHLETKGTFINAEGVHQKTETVVNSPGLARDSKKLFDLLLNKSSKTTPFELVSSSLDQFLTSSKITFVSKVYGGKSLISCVPFRPFFTDFFSCDPISKMSLTMIKCSNTYRKHFTNFFVS